MILLFILMLFLSVTTAQETRMFFADYLFNENKYQEAAIEYQRVIFSDTSGETNRFKLNLAKCYKEMDVPKAALHILKELLNDSGALDLQSRMLGAEINIQLGDYKTAFEWLEPLQQSNALLAKGYALFNLQRPQEAKNMLMKVPQQDSLFNKASRLCDYLKHTNAVKHKSYTIAGLLALMPGGGHLYTGRKGDALYSALLVGAFSGLTYFYYFNGSKTRGVACGTICGIFYGGSIYGALMGVKIHNREKRIGYYKKFNEIYQGK